MASLLTGHPRTWWQDLTTRLSLTHTVSVHRQPKNSWGRTRIRSYRLQLILPTNAISSPSVKTVAGEGIWAETQKDKAPEGLSASPGNKGADIKHN